MVCRMAFLIRQSEKTISYLFIDFFLIFVSLLFFFFCLGSAYAICISGKLEQTDWYINGRDSSVLKETPWETVGNGEGFLPQFNCQLRTAVGRARDRSNHGNFMGHLFYLLSAANRRIQLSLRSWLPLFFLLVT